ncbi:MAG: DNA-3-methyladenine glycosylase [Bacteroidota bacterium]
MDINNRQKRLGKDFFRRDVLDIAPGLLGNNLVINHEGIVTRKKITETEAYRGEEDLACHASKGKTPRNSIMFDEGGYIYIYLIYGMYWMLNIVTGPKDFPQAVLIRGVEGFPGPGKLTKNLNIDKGFHGENVVYSNKIWIEQGEGTIPLFYTAPRVGVDYAGEKWASKPWRFFVSTP